MNWSVEIGYKLLRIKNILHEESSSDKYSKIILNYFHNFFYYFFKKKEPWQEEKLNNVDIIKYYSNKININDVYQL